MYYTGIVSKQILIVLLMVAAIGGYLLFGKYLNNLNKPTTQTNSTQTATTSAETADWKTYTNTEAKVSFQYPLDWTVKGGETPKNADYKIILLEGKEGKISIDYGTGFGGACPAGYEDFNIGNAQTQACHTIKDNGSEEWSLGFIKNNINYGGFVTVNSPYKDNRDLVLNLLTTFKFIP